MASERASARILILGPGDREPEGVVDLGLATDEALARIAGSAGGERLMMSFDADQLPELAVAVARGVRIVRVEDVEAAKKVCRMLEAILSMRS